jgi:spore maturation protein CgeB
MSRELRVAYFVHSLRSDWNNGNAHFLRGLIREMGMMGHEVVVFEPRNEWSIENLMREADGEEALRQFEATYPELHIELYDPAVVSDCTAWRRRLSAFDVGILHEWNPPALAATLLELRDELEIRLLFHDTHHRASSSPNQIRLFGVDKFDGVIAFGEVLRNVYRERFGMTQVWTLHEAADTRVFRPIEATETTQDMVWVGNWGDEERTEEIREFLLQPAAAMPGRSLAIYGVRYPETAQREIASVRARYGGYLPNLEAPRVYAESRLTVHVPRRHYAREMIGIPTIRVFEVLACGIPLISAPWSDVEGLFRAGDFAFAHDGKEMRRTIERLLENPADAAAQAECGRETVLKRHTCAHRAAELSEIFEEVLR